MDLHYDLACLLLPPEEVAEHIDSLLLIAEADLVRDGRTRQPLDHLLLLARRRSVAELVEVSTWLAGWAAELDAEGLPVALPHDLLEAVALRLVSMEQPVGALLLDLLGQIYAACMTSTGPAS